MDMGFRLTGEGFVLIAQLSYGASTVLINIFSKKVSPVILSGCQFFMGGVLLFIVGILMGGHLDHMSIAGVVLILYLAMVSAVAYTLWVGFCWRITKYRKWRFSDLSIHFAAWCYRRWFLEKSARHLMQEV